MFPGSPKQSPRHVAPSRKSRSRGICEAIWPVSEVILPWSSGISTMERRSHWLPDLDEKEES